MNDIKQKVIAVAKVDVAFFNYFFSLGIYYDCVSICLFFFFRSQTCSLNYEFFVYCQIPFVYTHHWKEEERK